MKVYLICNAGMSTGILQIKLEEEAKKRGLELTIEAVPMIELNSILDDVDLILLGPQIRFAEEDIRKTTTKPIIVISPTDFGLMKVDNILNDIIKILNM